jgi:hypothetical protein
MAANRRTTAGFGPSSQRPKDGRQLTTGQDEAITGKWIAWNHDQTRLVARARTRAEAKEAARRAGVPEPVLENVEQTRKLLADRYAGAEELCQKLLGEEGELLSASAVGRLVGIAADEVEERRVTGRLIAFPRKGAFAFPSWQFAEDGTLSGLEDVLADLHRHNHHPLADLRFFLSPNLRLDNETPLARLRGGMIDEVRRAARAYGEHGAA